MQYQTIQTNISMQHRAIPYNTRQYRAIPCNKKQQHLRYNAIPWNVMPYDTMLYNAILSITMYCHTIPCIAMKCQYYEIPSPFNNIQYHAILFATMQYHIMPCNTISIQCCVISIQYHAISVQYHAISIQYHAIIRDLVPNGTRSRIRDLLLERLQFSLHKCPKSDSNSCWILIMLLCNVAMSIEKADLLSDL